MKRAYRWLGLLLFLLATIYFLLFAIEHAEALYSSDWGAGAYRSLIYATVVYCVTMLVGAGTWSMLMYDAGESSSFTKLSKVFLLSQFAKYIPGNIAHHLGRIALARSYDIGISRVTFTMILETSITIIAGVFASSIALFYQGERLLGGDYYFSKVWQFGFLISAGLVSLIAVAWALGRARPKLFAKLTGDGAINIPKTRVLALSLLLYLLSFLLMGLVVYLILFGVFEVSEVPFWVVTGIFALAWVAGFITPGAPAGFGVREAILITLLKPLYGGGIALGVTIALRIVTMIGDGIVFVVTLLSVRREISRVSSH